MNVKQQKALESITIVPNHNPNLYQVMSYSESFPDDRKDVGYDLVPIVGWKMYAGYMERNVKGPEYVSIIADPIIPTVSNEVTEHCYVIYDKERDTWQTYDGGNQLSEVGEESLLEYLREQYGLKKKSELTVV